MRFSTRSVLVLAALLPACTAPADDGDGNGPNGGGKADDIEPANFACQNVTIAGGLDALVEKRDPIAQLLLKQGDTCPTNYAEMVEKFRAVDGEDCIEGEDLRTRIVSDDARLTDDATNYRTFTTRNCGSHNEHDLAWTLLNVRADENIGNRSFIEMMAFDPQSNLFNFYTLSGGWNFEGSTIEVLDGSIGCASCHNGGGLIMKELDRPWIHWEADGFDIPGADRMFEQHAPMFGVRGDGEELEAVVRAGNEAIIDGRIEHHTNPAVGSVNELLRPLFCQVEMNLDTAAEQPGAPVEQLPADFFVDPHWGIERGVAMDDATYEATIEAANQRVEGISPAPRDTAFKFVYPERAGIDVRYVERLLELGVIDRDFATDVMAIDFTNPLYSSARCDLLDFAPEFGEPEPITGDDDPTGDDPTGDDPTGDDTTGDDTTGDDTTGDAVDPGNCCSEHEGTGCTNADIQACVCAADDFCCNNTWDSACASGVEDNECFDCNGDGEFGGSGFEPGPSPSPSSGLKISKADPDTIRAAFIDALKTAEPGEGTAAAALLSHLSNREDASDHKARVEQFFEVCTARPADELMADVLRVAHGLRSRTRGMSIIEHSEQMPTADLEDSLVALDAATCALPKAPEPVPEPEPDPV